MVPGICRAALRAVLILCLISLCGISCFTGDDPEPSKPLKVALQLLDENSQPLQNGWYQVRDEIYEANDKGMVSFKFQRPVMGIAGGAGAIDEPVALGWDDVDTTVTVSLFKDSPNRWVYHAGGDAMFGRRYLEPETGLPLLSAYDDGESARALVSEISDVFSMADFVSVNLETVVGDLADDLIYPGKRWILISPPNSLHALEALGVNAVSLANNHVRDYMEPGVSTTLQALSRLGIANVGGSETDPEAWSPLVYEKGDIRVALLSYTTVDGDYVNDSYPTDSDELPSSVEEQDLWMWLPRTWGFSAEGVDIPEMERRIGSAWAAASAVETDLDSATLADMWASLVEVYPEMQDWVARRGHGGAARWETTACAEAIEKAKSENDVVVVQLHSGFQFMPAPSGSVKDNARTALDSGADIVIAHHPHVLQGIEWYKGKPIFYSLGNFIFDQNFFSTFNTLLLRTIWERDELLQVRLIPMQLEGYKPVFAVDRAADWVLGDVWDKSLLSAVCERGQGDRVFTETTTRDADSMAPAFHFEHHSAVIDIDSGETSTQRYTISPGQTIALDRCIALSRKLDSPDIEIGRELFGWGHFEDSDTDEYEDDTTHWDYEPTQYKSLVQADCPQGRFCFEMKRSSTNESNLMLRPLARVPLYDHRLFQFDGAEYIAADPKAGYSVRVLAKANGQSDAFVRLNFYHFDDLDPTVAPESALIRETPLPLNIPGNNTWHEIFVDLDPAALEPNDPDDPINFVLPYLFLPPPAKGNITAWFDDLGIIEWKKGSELPEGWGVYHFLRNTGSKEIEVKLTVRQGCTSQ